MATLVVAVGPVGVVGIDGVDGLVGVALGPETVPLLPPQAASRQVTTRAMGREDMVSVG
jgi:hypothetical protein